MRVWLNGRLVPAARARVPVFDRGFLYGDAVYETVRLRAGAPLDWTAHERRLRASARLASLPCPSAAALRRAMRAVARANRLNEATLRICLSRGESPLGLDPGSTSKPSLAILVHPPRDLTAIWTKGLSVALVSRQRLAAACLDPRIKTASALPLVLARLEARRAGADEALLLNARGDLAEGTVSNVFLVRQGRLYTPASAVGILEGTTRRRVLAAAGRLGIKVIETRLRPADLWAADELFVTNVTWRIAPVARLIDGRRSGRHRIRRWSVPGPLSKLLLPSMN